MKKVSFWLLLLILLGKGSVFTCLANVDETSFAISDMAEFEGVLVSPDGRAWTTNYLEQDRQIRIRGYTITTGVGVLSVTPATGEHYYEAEEKGAVPIYKWVVQWPTPSCSHYYPGQNYHGIQTDGRVCGYSYHSGWYGYCAVCEGPIAQMYVYGKEETLKEITYVPGTASYFYVCPFCNGLEQGMDYHHICKKVSANHYIVSYEANAPAGSAVEGDMEVTKHMYNNAEQYEGQSALEQGYADTKLRENLFVCEGYVFAGWNEKADGTGESFLDGEDIFNLCEENGGMITLYAQWREEAEVETVIPQIHTELLGVKESEFVHFVADDICYVKADGETEHTFVAEAYLENGATQDLQIDCIRIYAEADSESKRIEIYIPHADILNQSESFESDRVSVVLKPKEFGRFLVGSASAMRTEHARRVRVEQIFSLEANSESFYAFPDAAVMHGGKEYVSSLNEDVEHGIEIIPDGTCPTIDGLEQLEAFRLLDMSQEVVNICLRAEDTGSGLQEFSLIVKNLDSQTERVFYADANGEIQITVDKTDSLYMGELLFTILAVDHVGNANVIGKDGLTFTLDAVVYKARAPEETIFKAGDGAVLEMHASGYVERIEVKFPEEWLATFPKLNQVYHYEPPSLRNTEELTFSIPLESSYDIYDVTVTAYKNGKNLICKPNVIVVEGSVLDELRTRIRNNE